jgi:hypothetical protein
MLELSDDVLSMLNNGLCPMNYGKEKGLYCNIVYE